MTELEILKTELAKIDTYPSTMKAVHCEITGRGFFPGARGLSIDGDKTLSNKPIMILGQDFGAIADFDLSKERSFENPTALTWRNLSEMLKQFEISEEECFFTNTFMGVRTTGSAMGRCPGYNHFLFLNDCRNFLIKQISTQRPRIIIALGLQLLEAISEVSESLNPLKEIKSFKKLDEKGFAIFNSVEFKGVPNFKSNIVFITHPTYHHLNVKHRRFNGLEEIEAEKALIKSALNLSTI